jgi:hypothetical protein
MRWGCGSGVRLLVGEHSSGWTVSDTHIIQQHMFSILVVELGVQDEDAASKTAGVIPGRANAAGGESGPCKQKNRR